MAKKLSQPNALFVSVFLLLGCPLLSGCPARSNSTQLMAGDMANLQSNVANIHKRLTILEKRVEKMSATVSETEKSVRQTKADQSVINEDLRTELRTLKGSLDVLDHQLKQQSKDAERFRQDFDARIAELETRVYQSKSGTKKTEKSAPARSKTTASGAEAGVDDITRYNQILQIMYDKDYPTAIDQFRGFIRNHSSSSLADNAQYWLAESYYAQGEYSQAIKEYQAVVSKYPDSDKACDAILKQGFAFDELKKPDKAKLFLVEVTKRCPNTKVSTLASERIRRLEASTN